MIWRNISTAGRIRFILRTRYSANRALSVLQDMGIGPPKREYNYVVVDSGIDVLGMRFRYGIRFRETSRIGVRKVTSKGLIQPELSL
jgi:hypothetical protein